MMTREEILAVYEAGPDAVVSLVQSLFAHFEALTERVRELEIRLGKDSHNSHKPPSSDEPTFRRPARKSLRKRSGKKPGGQPSHTGCTRLQVETRMRCTSMCRTTARTVGTTCKALTLPWHSGARFSIFPCCA